MKHNLVIDRGNSSTKAALYSGSALIDVISSHDPEDAVSRIVQKHGVQLQAVLFSTVGAGGEKAMEFLRGYAPWVRSVKALEKYPIRLVESQFREMGADRIAAAAGAYELYPGSDILVVDSGTAVTYDVVGADGTFMGGNIAPGIQMGLDALHRCTALLPQIDAPMLKDHCLLGDDTESAMIKGVVFNVVGAIESMCARLEHTPRVVLTGGNAPLFAPLLRVEYTVVPHLVPDGLNYILRYLWDAL